MKKAHQGSPGSSKKLKNDARLIFKKNKSIYCPAFPDEKVFFNSEGVSHLFYKGSKKVSSRLLKEVKVRVDLLPRAIKLLKMMPLPQEEFSTIGLKNKRYHYYAFEAVVDGRRIKVIVRQVGNGKKHFWSVIPAWRRVRGERVNAKGDLSGE